ncbi:hypothetical protein ACIBK9_18270 [Nonomuraea sp. NPDC050227]|uniref:golvesin C-terminal-like domain-containing protein n=1 Tax=Nonomuraea sp. NPDC050227 TaxID=3364360 RepID=UPI00378A15BD
MVGSPWQSRLTFPLRVVSGGEVPQLWAEPGSVAAKYTVKHDGGTADVVVDQTDNAGTWVDLGSCTFTAGTAQSITLTDAANGPLMP